MKKLVFFSVGSLFLANLFFFFNSAKTESLALNNNHAVSVGKVETEDFKPLISTTVANKPVEVMAVEEISLDTFAKTYPNLTITGEIQIERLTAIQKTLLALPKEKLQTLTTLKIIQVEGQSRGLAGTRTLILNDFKLSEEEMLSVFVHELGHIIDLGGITGTPAFPRSNFNDGPNPIYRNDKSTVFYAYSWIDSYQKKQTADRLDFVSGYAMTDPFEDFAESFAYYVLHNRDFKLLAQHNAVLEQKYNWIRDNVFAGNELDTGKMQVNSSRRVWDITKLPINI